MDKTDVALISALQADGRRSYASLASELFLGISTVRRRVNRLLEEGVILPTVAVNPFSIGLENCALVGLNVALPRLDSVMEALAKEPEIHFMTSTTGRFDVFIAVHCSSNRDLATFLSERLSAIEGISHSETFVWLRIYMWNRHLTRWQR